MKTDRMYLVIPAYEPDERLVELVESVTEAYPFQILVVDDGSSEACSPIFEKLQSKAVILHHKKNRGKGCALKTACAWLMEHHAAGVVVTADADGQHAPEDIACVAWYSFYHPDALVLGKRSFQGKVSLKSRLGNGITRYIFRAQSGCRVEDTQTGLRAFSTEALSFMEKMEGNRYEYEMNVLLFWAKEGRPVGEVPIRTIYLDGNRSSHFRPVKDGWRIYRDLFRFGGVSMLSFFLDYLLYGLFTAFLPLAATLRILVANTAARVISGGFNFEMNRRYVFQKEGNVAGSALKYLTLAISIYLLSTGSIAIFYRLFHASPYLLKILVDGSLFFISWYVQKHLIFVKQ